MLWVGKVADTLLNDLGSLCSLLCHFLGLVADINKELAFYLRNSAREPTTGEHTYIPAGALVELRQAQLGLSRREGCLFSLGDDSRKPGLHLVQLESACHFVDLILGEAGLGCFEHLEFTQILLA